jgi:hypothetical protein
MLIALPIKHRCQIDKIQTAALMSFCIKQKKIALTIEFSEHLRHVVLVVGPQWMINSREWRATECIEPSTHSAPNIVQDIVDFLLKTRQL